MDHILVVRVAVLYVPAVLVVLAWVLRPPGRLEAAAALLASSWCVWSLLLVNVVAIRTGSWTFATVPGAMVGVPVDVLIGWALLWGALPVIALRALPLPVLIAAFTMLDVVIMPLGAPLVTLSPRWLTGEALAIVLALIPAQLLARWTILDRRLRMRAAMQAASFGILMLWVLPEVIFQHTGGSWTHFLGTWSLAGGMPLQLALLPALIGVTAVQEFAERGGGTPIPFDPPRRLVTSGAYAYVANPMQLSLALMLTAWGVLIGSGWMMLAGPMAVAYGLGLASSDESHSLGARFGRPWRTYRQHVRSWIPRLRPFHASVDLAASEHDTVARPPARLYVSATCGRCAEVAAWFAARRPRGLEIVPAELHPSRDLWRITYDPRDETPDEEGVPAVARALEHVHLGWAALGWTMRLPVLRTLLQILVDASGGEPRRIERAREASSVEHCKEVPSCTR